MSAQGQVEPQRKDVIQVYCPMQPGAMFLMCWFESVIGISLSFIFPSQRQERASNDIYVFLNSNLHHTMDLILRAPARMH